MQDVTTSPDTMIGETIIMYTGFLIDAYDFGQTNYKLSPIFSPRNHGDESRDDIQILYFDKGEYFFCVRYNHLDGKLTIYNPSEQNILHPEVRRVLETLYPSVRSHARIEVVTLSSIMPYQIPSGLASIIVATTLLFGINPSDVNLRWSSSRNRAYYLWKHLEQIFRQKRITPFPVDSSSPSMQQKSSIQPYPFDNQGTSQSTKEKLHTQSVPGPSRQNPTITHIPPYQRTPAVQPARPPEKKLSDQSTDSSIREKLIPRTEPHRKRTKKQKPKQSKVASLWEAIKSLFCGS